MTAEQVYHYLRDQHLPSRARSPGFNIISAGVERSSTRFDQYKRYIGSFYECDVDIAELDLIEPPVDKIVIVGSAAKQPSPKVAAQTSA